uniref:Uncharacterized protein n=1 Tax=Romanomermis culicivorax TaxID=13658 RepID=A0A915KEN2_ROMCU
MFDSLLRSEDVSNITKEAIRLYPNISLDEEFENISLNSFDDANVDPILEDITSDQEENESQWYGKSDDESEGTVSDFDKDLVEYSFRLE